MSVAELKPAKPEIDRQITNHVVVSSAKGGIAFTNMSEVMEFAKLMAVSGTAVPAHLRNAPGVCLAICIQAIEWRMSPYAVASKSYVVNDKVAYESQLIHAVIEQRAPITERLKNRFIGEGDNRQCIVWATSRGRGGESETLEYTSPPIGKITPKNSPLWKAKPDLQLFYNTSRDWARMYFPDVILGVYSDDELPQDDFADRVVNANIPKTSISKLDDLTNRLTNSEPSEDRISADVAKLLEEFDADCLAIETAEGVEKFATKVRAGVAASDAWSDQEKQYLEEKLAAIATARCAEIGK